MEFVSCLHTYSIDENTRENKIEDIEHWPSSDPDVFRITLFMSFLILNTFFEGTLFFLNHHLDLEFARSPRDDLH